MVVHGAALGMTTNSENGLTQLYIQRSGFKEGMVIDEDDWCMPTSTINANSHVDNHAVCTSPQGSCVVTDGRILPVHVFEKVSIVVVGFGIITQCLHS